MSGVAERAWRDTAVVALVISVGGVWLYGQGSVGWVWF